jgi:hypothetical protein
MKLRPGLISNSGSSGGGSGGAIIPSYIAKGTPRATSGSTTVGYPTGVTTDDILILLQETNASDAAPTAPSGWAEITNSPSTDSTFTRLSAFWKRYDGTGSDVTSGMLLSDAGDHQIAVILGFRNCIQTGNPWDVTAAGSNGASDTSMSLPSVTTTGTNRLILLAASTDYEQDDTGAEFSGWTNASLTGITEILDFHEDNGDGGGIGAAYGFMATAAATGATTATSANAGRHAYLTIALKGQTG